MPTSKTKNKNKNKNRGGVTSKPVSSPQDWKRKTGTAAASNVELPSGVVVKVKRISIPTLLSKGVFPDSLSSIITEKLDGDKKGQTTDNDLDVSQLLGDQSKITDLFNSIDEIVLMTVVEPTVLSDKDEDGDEIPEEDRDEDAIYVSDIDLNDKIFLFQYSVGGSNQLEPFRAELDSAVGSLEDQQGIPQASQ